MSMTIIFYSHNLGGELAFNAVWAPWTDENETLLAGLMEKMSVEWMVIYDEPNDQTRRN